MPFEYRTIYKPDNFWPFEYQTSPVFRWLLYVVPFEGLFLNKTMTETIPTPGETKDVLKFLKFILFAKHIYWPT